MTAGRGLGSPGQHSTTQTCLRRGAADTSAGLEHCATAWQQPHVAPAVSTTSWSTFAAMLMLHRGRPHATQQQGRGVVPTHNTYTHATLYAGALAERCPSVCQGITGVAACLVGCQYEQPPAGGYEQLVAQQRHCQAHTCSRVLPGGLELLTGALCGSLADPTRGADSQQGQFPCQQRSQHAHPSGVQDTPCCVLGRHQQHHHVDALANKWVAVVLLLRCTPSLLRMAAHEARRWSPPGPSPSYTCQGGGVGR